MSSGETSAISMHASPQSTKIYSVFYMLVRNLSRIWYIVNVNDKTAQETKQIFRYWINNEMIN